MRKNSLWFIEGEGLFLAEAKETGLHLFWPES